MIPPVGWYVRADASRTVRSRPTWRSISVVPSWKWPARAWIAVPAWRSTASTGTPSRASSIALVRPTRLPPTIRTGISSGVTAVSCRSGGRYRLRSGQRDFRGADRAHRRRRPAGRLLEPAARHLRRLDRRGAAARDRAGRRTGAGALAAGDDAREVSRPRAALPGHRRW